MTTKNDWDALAEAEPWLVPADATIVTGSTAPSGTWRPAAPEFTHVFPELSTLLSSARVTPVAIGSKSYFLFTWGRQPEGASGWLSPVPTASSLSHVFEDHRLLLRSFGGITERFNEPETSWLLNLDDALTVESSQCDATFIQDYAWAFEAEGIPIPIDLSEYYCIAREANGNATLCERNSGNLVMFAPDHFFDHLVPLEGCPEYTLYRITGAPVVRQWIRRVAEQWQRAADPA